MSNFNDGVILRQATLEDIPGIALLMGIAIEWLGSEGRTGQWGTGKASENPDRIKQLTEFFESGGTWVLVDTNAADTVSATADNGPHNQGEGAVGSGGGKTRNQALQGIIGALTVSSDAELKPWITPASEPELYISFLITHRAWNGRGVGKRLMEQARKLAQAAGVSLLRVDCYAGDDGKLVRYYESQGFERTEAFEERGWKGQILAQRLV
jgi:ribosomal protein S18 acetylase RimI-like enzyme